MKRSTCCWNTFTRIIVAILLIATPILTSCGGGGGGAGESTNDIIENSNSIPDQLVAQNNKAFDYFTKYRELVEESILIEERLDMADPIDITEMDAIIGDIEKNNLLAQEIVELGDEIYEIEQRLMKSTSSQSASFNAQMSYVKPQAAGVVLGVCSVGLTLYAGISSQKNSIQKAYQEKDACIETYKKDKEKYSKMYHNNEISKEYFEILMRLADEECYYCLDAADWGYYSSYYDDVVMGFVSIFGPETIIHRTSKILFQSFSGAWDTTTLYILGKQDDSKNGVSPEAEEEIDDNVSFMAVIDENQEISIPVGDWTIIAFKPGYARFGTQTSQRISVEEGETTIVDYSTIPSNTATEANINECTYPSAGPTRFVGKAGYSCDNFANFWDVTVDFTVDDNGILSGVYSGIWDGTIAGSVSSSGELTAMLTGLSSDSWYSGCTLKGTITPDNKIVNTTYTCPDMSCSSESQNWEGKWWATEQ